MHISSPNEPFDFRKQNMRLIVSLDMKAFWLLRPSSDRFHTPTGTKFCTDRTRLRKLPKPTGKTMWTYRTRLRPIPHLGRHDIVQTPHALAAAMQTYTLTKKMKTWSCFTGDDLQAASHDDAHICDHMYGQQHAQKHDGVEIRRFNGIGVSC